MAKDLYHNIVRNALIKDGWTITHDPLRLEDTDINMKYETLIIDLLNDYKGDNVDYYLVIDKQNHHYQLLGSGWSNQNTYYCRIFMHFHLRQDGIICIFENHTEIELVDVLMEHGVPKSDILVSFLPLAARQYAGYAVA